MAHELKLSLKGSLMGNATLSSWSSCCHLLFKWVTEEVGLRSLSSPFRSPYSPHYIFLIETSSSATHCVHPHIYPNVLGRLNFNHFPHVLVLTIIIISSNMSLLRVSLRRWRDDYY